MAIKPSAGSEIRALVEALGAPDEVRREAAIARLSVIGPRAIDRLAASFAAPDTPRATKGAILRILEGIGDPRTIPLARKAIVEGGDVGVAAASALRPLLGSTVADASAEALDLLMTVVMDGAVEHRVRAAAFEALQDVPDVRERLSGVLADPPDGHAVDAIWRDAIEGRLPDSAAPLREAAQLRAASAPLGSLQKLVDAVGGRESDPEQAAKAADWRALRGALHQALALRGSRIALYDVRETLEGADGPLPSTFLTALHLVGDESCLPAIASAHTRAANDPRWQQQLAAAFHAIVKREKLSRKPAAKLLREPRRG
jgi:hypothetical protein